MHKFFHSLHIRLSGTTLRMSLKKNWSASRNSVLADIRFPDDVVSRPERLNELIANAMAQSSFSGMAARFILADELVRFFMVTPPQNPANLDDFRAAAAMRFQALYEETPANWHISADWNTDGPFLTCAIPRDVSTALHRAAASRKIRVIEITPNFISAANHWRKKLLPQAWFGSIQENTLALGAVHRQRFKAVRCTRVPDEAWTSDHWLPDFLKKEALRLDLPFPETIQLCGSFPGHWTKKEFGALTCIRLGKPDANHGESAASAGFALNTSRQAQ